MLSHDVAATAQTESEGPEIGALSVFEARYLSGNDPTPTDNADRPEAMGVCIWPTVG